MGDERSRLTNKHYCPHCEREIDAQTKAEHDDWHFAKDLDEQDNNAVVSQSQSVAPPSYQSPTDSKSLVQSDMKQDPSFTHAQAMHQKSGGKQVPGNNTTTSRRHVNAVDEAATLRAKDEQMMQNALQNLQLRYRIYNPEIEPEHETENPCSCPIHQYQRMKRSRRNVLEQWSAAVMYPGEKVYNDFIPRTPLFSNNPYLLRITSPYGFGGSSWSRSHPQPSYHVKFIHQTIQLNNSLNHEAQRKVDALEPRNSIWEDRVPEMAMSQLSVTSEKDKLHNGNDDIKCCPPEKGKLPPTSRNNDLPESTKVSRFSAFRKAVGIKSSEERAVAKTEKEYNKGLEIRNNILQEEAARWPDHDTRQIVAAYQNKVGMETKIAHLRACQPLQYLHLLRAGYFEPIPVAWADQQSNILTFSIEAAGGWRGITPSWRGYEDTAEERLYWVLNHREGPAGVRMKPDFISEMNMARDRMAKAVEPPPDYYSANDTCHLQHTSEGYSKQVMPPPFRSSDRPEVPTDDTMILLDVSGSMDFDPLRPNYDQYLITGYSHSTQPKNKDVAKAVIRRFIDAMANHDHEFRGYDLVTFSSHAKFAGTVNHTNLDATWDKVKIGGGTRVMTGWQRVKQRHFEKHSESATYHPIYGWQAGPETPMLRLLLLLDGEATDMDEFELELLGLSWAHVTIFLIGVDGCPHHHRHANELQRISDVNYHVSFVDAQGNTPERFVTHELLKRHLGYDLSMSEFQELEELPPYVE
ncbi:hypothetical protein D6D20_08527 [Aureobasidium pullulans]|uniref:UBZ3-type domain-containing protein n=1 Tax=Aureobasidium pullulans TaxID=5580 RepID=A0A4S8YZE8_AURPU|nr:hypothetical protein D6D20_08527 [Aureobasidium pullulans]